MQRTTSDERQPARSPDAARRKATLVCPGCGHESDVDGDWVLDESDSRRRYVCPNCGTVVVSQPTFARANAA